MTTGFGHARCVHQDRTAPTGAQPSKHLLLFDVQGRKACGFEGRRVAVCSCAGNSPCCARPVGLVA